MGGAQVFDTVKTWGELHKLLDDLYWKYEVKMWLRLEALSVVWSSEEVCYKVAVRFRK